MDTIFMNPETSETSKSHVLTLKLTNKLYLRLGEYLHQRGMINLNYQMDHILYQIFKIILSVF